MRLVLYTGKGGVGKTTTAAATAACAAARGLRTLVVSADAAHSLGDVLGQRLGPEPRIVSAPERSGTTPDLEDQQGRVGLEARGDLEGLSGLEALGRPGSGGRGAARTPAPLHAMEIDPRVEVDLHYGRIRDYLVSLFRYQGIDSVVADELALLPGAEEITTLLAVEEHASAGGFDLVVVDCAPTDSTLRLLTLPDVAHGSLRFLLKLQRAVSSIATPIARGIIPAPLPDAKVFRDVERLLFQRMRELRQRISAPSTSVRLVVTPERMVIDEARRAHTQLALFDAGCDAVVMNRLLPESATREPFFRDWGALQRERLDEVEAAFAPLPVLRAPLREDEVIGLEALTRHGEALFEGRDPAALLCEAPRVRFQRAGRDYRVHVPLPGIDASDLEVSVVDGELIVRAGSVRRALALPPRIARLPLTGASLERPELVVRFDDESPAAPAG